MKFLERTDGTIVVEERTERYPGDSCWINGHKIGPDAPDAIPYWPETGEDRPVEVGDEGCLTTGQGTDTVTTSVQLFDSPEGIGGNSDPDIRRLHGWRGSFNDFATYAHGWRRVIEVRPVGRGVGTRVVLSEDLRPEEA